MSAGPPLSQAPHPDCQSTGQGAWSQQTETTRCSTDRCVSWGQPRSLSKAQGLDKKVPQAPVALTSMIIDTE